LRASANASPPGMDDMKRGLDFEKAEAAFKRAAYKATHGMREERAGQYELYIERRPQGDYAVRRGGSERASAVAPTQQKAIEKAERLDPKAAVLVERVRDTKIGSRDKWRKP
jgi:hypothetical protein